MLLTLALGFYTLPSSTLYHPCCMSYNINTSTAHHINSNLPIAATYYNKIFTRISGPPCWLLKNLYKAFKQVETPTRSFLCYNPHWNETIEEIVPSYNTHCHHPTYTGRALVCTCCCCHYHCPTHSPEFYSY